MNEFLKELLALCHKYQANISGCGCCGSPSVSIPMGEGREVVDEVCVDGKDGKLTYESSVGRAELHLG